MTLTYNLLSVYPIQLENTEPYKIIENNSEYIRMKVNKGINLQGGLLGVVGMQGLGVDR